MLFEVFLTTAGKGGVGCCCSNEECQNKSLEIIRHLFRDPLGGAAPKARGSAPEREAHGPSRPALSTLRRDVKIYQRGVHSTYALSGVHYRTYPRFTSTGSECSKTQTLPIPLDPITL
jgi:hypothetical protein